MQLYPLLSSLPHCHYVVVQVGALSCAFVRGHVRDRDECMISLCTFGKLLFAGRNNQRHAAKSFKSFLDHTCLKAILSRFDEFNRRGGAFVRMNGEIVHFERACVVGMYADLPAATKLCLTGSACNTCFMSEDQMPVPYATAEMRTWPNMNAKIDEFLARIEAGETVTSVSKEAKRIGVNYRVANAFSIPPSGINPIGPDPVHDTPWSACPPVFLHAMEAGTLMKLSESSLEYVIRRQAYLGVSKTAACRIIDKYVANLAVARPRNSNVEIGGMALLPMPHGITSHILNTRSLDGHKRSSVARYMHMYIASSNIFSDHQQQQHCQM